MKLLKDDPKLRICEVSDDDDDDHESDDSSSSSSAHGDPVQERQKAARKQKRQQRKASDKAARKLKKATEKAKLAAKAAQEKCEKAARKAKRDKAKEEKRLKREAARLERAKKLAAEQKAVAKGAKPKISEALKALTKAKELAEECGGAVQYGSLLDHHVTSLTQLASSCNSLLAGDNGAQLPEALKTPKAINNEIATGQKTAAFVSQQFKHRA